MYRTITLIIISILLTACSSDSYDDYLGYWSKNGRSNNKIMEIRKVNGNYILNENVFKQSKRGPSDIVLKKENGLLSMGFGSALVLSEDKNELISGLGAAKRISDEKFKELNNLEQLKIANSKKCKELRYQAGQENPKAFSGSILFGEDLLKANQTIEKYQNQAKEIGLINCRI